MPPKVPSSDNTAKLRELIPERILAFLGRSPAIGLDSERDFDNLFKSLIVDLGYRDTLEIFDIRDMAEVRWEIERAKSSRRAAIEKHLPKVATDLMGSAYVESLGEKEMEKSDIQADLTLMFRAAGQGDRASRKSLEALANKAGITNRILQLEAYCRALKEIAPLDEDIARLERRSDQIVRKFEDRRKNLGAMSRSLLHGSRTVDIEPPIDDAQEGGAKT